MDKFDARYHSFRHRGGGIWGHHGHRGALGKMRGPSWAASEIVLSETSPGEECVFVRFVCNHPAFRGRMMSLGLMPGVRLRVVEGGRGRPFLVEIYRGGIFMLDAKSAAMIAVRRLPVDSGREEQ
jgi:Fe2+ transport system protein FeoA